MMFTPRFTWAVLVLVVALSIEGHSFGQETPDPQEQQAAREESIGLARLWMIYQRGHLLLEGTVFDQDGKPIPEFAVEYPQPRTEKDLAKLDHAALTRSFLGVGKVEEEIAGTRAKIAGKEGRFQIDAKYIDFSVGIRLRLHGTGYYDAEIRIDRAISEEEDDALNKAVVNSFKMKEWSPPKEVPIKKKIKVLLRKMGTPTKLERAFVDLDVTRNGDRTGYKFAPLGKGKAESIRVTSKERFPQRSLFLTAKRDETGKFSVRQAGWKFEVSTGAELEMHADQGDGFVKYIPTSFDTGDAGVKYEREPFRRAMMVAPETGYQPKLKLSTEELAQLEPAESPKFFFKCAGRYGRASYYGCRVSEDHSSFTIRLAIEIQSDGSRNLETGE